MNYKKIIFALIFVLTLGGLGLGITSSEASQKEKITKEEEQQLKENFLNMGIADKTADKLVKKVIKGELLDSQKEEELDKHKDQLVVSTEDAPQYIEFDDGSRISLSVEEEKPAFNALDYATGTVKANSCQSGTGYKNCSVTARYNDGIWNIYFNAQVNSVQGGYDKISSISREGVDAVMYNVAFKKFKILRGTETSTAAAKAEYTNQFTHKLGLYTLSRSLTLYAEDDKTYARLNYY
jgi:hypothetical protein